MKNGRRLLVTLAMVLILVATACGGPSTPAPTAKPPAQKFTVMWSVYVGWMPWPYAQESGILKKWADKYNIVIDLKRADYIPSIEAYVAGQADAVVMTNMEALNMAAAAGIDSTAIIIGDYSNGNDAVLTRNGLTLPELKGKKVSIVELSVSQFLLERGLEEEGKGVKVTDMTLVNTSDADIGPAFISDASQVALVSWNPIVLDVLTQVTKVTNAFNSSKIPHEILDVMFVRTEVLNKNPNLAKALTGAWYETMRVMTTKDPARDKALEAMAKESGTTLASYNKQLETTFMYWLPKNAATFTQSPKLVEVMDLVRKFSFDHGLWTGAKTVDEIGIEFPGAKTLGDAKHIGLRFTDTYMQMAADGKL